MMFADIPVSVVLSESDKQNLFMIETDDTPTAYDSSRRFPYNRNIFFLHLPSRAYSINISKLISADRTH